MSRYIQHGSSRRVVDLGPDRENIVPLAQNIAIHRGTLVCEAIFHFAAIRSLHANANNARHAVVECRKAQVQSSTAQRGQQAAHLLPGQVLVNGAPIWQLAVTRDNSIAGEVLRLKHQTMMCFAATNVLPALFNRADTEAEGKGDTAASQTLKPLFGDVVRTLWQSARVHADRPLRLDREATVSALQRWFSDISRVYSDAAARKLQRNRQEEARVLDTYAQSFRVANVLRFVHAHTPQVYQRYAFLDR